MRNNAHQRTCGHSQMPHKPECGLLKDQTHVYIYSWINKGVIIGYKGRGQVTFKWRDPNQSRTICKENNFKFGLWAHSGDHFLEKTAHLWNAVPCNPYLKLCIWAAHQGCLSVLTPSRQEGNAWSHWLISTATLWIVCDSRGQSFSVNKRAVVIQDRAMTPNAAAGPGEKFLSILKLVLPVSVFSCW